VEGDLRVAVEVSPPPDQPPLHILHERIKRCGRDGVPPPAKLCLSCQVEHGQI
jgi:hypothetical protein